MTSVGQYFNIILEGHCMEIFTHNYVVDIRGYLQNLGLAPRYGTLIFDRVFLDIEFGDRAHTDFVSNLPRDITSRNYTHMGGMVACWISICKLQIAIGLTHISSNLITQGFVSPCHMYNTILARK
jgi:hypothetical protein